MSKMNFLFALWNQLSYIYNDVCVCFIFLLDLLFTAVQWPWASVFFNFGWKSPSPHVCRTGHTYLFPASLCLVYNIPPFDCVTIYQWVLIYFQTNNFEFWSNQWVCILNWTVKSINNWNFYWETLADSYHFKICFHG